jgi:hypothetical protein
MPLSSLAEAEAWRVAHFGSAGKNARQCKQENFTPAENGGAVLPERPEPVNASDLSREDFIGTLARLKKNELVAWSLLASAVRDRNDTEIMTRQRQYKDAVGLRVMQEKHVDEILIKRGELVTLESAKELFGRHLQSLRLTLKTLPVRLAARCNPYDPELAKTTLQEAVERMFKTMNEWSE